MKTILWATLTANGNYARASSEHAPKKEALDDFGAFAEKTGNFIVGRRTYEGFRAGGANAAFAGTEIVVVSEKSSEISGATRVGSPLEALNFLERKGHQTALLVGGETLNKGFLAAGLVDELIFNIVPALESKGLNLLLPDGQYKEVKLLNYKDIGGGIVQLHYELSN